MTNTVTSIHLFPHTHMILMVYNTHSSFTASVQYFCFYVKIFTQTEDFLVNHKYVTISNQLTELVGLEP